MRQPNASLQRSALKPLALLILTAGLSQGALATDGYFAQGYGTKAEGIAGVGIALPQDSLAAASNPAGTALVGNRADAGITWFKPDRGSSIRGNAYGANGDYDGDATSSFLIPNIGYTHQLSSDSAFGIAAYANGGMNTDYNRNPFAAFGSKGSGGINMSQLFIAPSYAYKLNEQNSIGISVIYAIQRFSASGVGAFAPASMSPTNLTDRGHDSSTGWGARLGWTGQITDTLTLGATWASNISTSEFDKYKGLFAGGGGFDIPENYGVGLAWRATSELTIAADYQRILYNTIDSVGFPLSNLFAGHPLGADNGPGFGWQNISTYKIGFTYAVSPELTLRAGYNHSDNPIPADQTFFNILAPGIIQHHYSIGATWKVGHGELSAAYTHAAENTMSGSNSIPPSFGGGNADLRLQEDLASVSYAWKY